MGPLVKVLHIVGESKFGGGSVMVADLAAMARDMNWQVDVLTTDPEFIRVLQDARIGVVPIEVIWRNIRPVRDLRGLWRLYKFLKRNSYTLVHTHTSKGGFVGRVAAWMARTPAIVHTAHGFAFHERSHPVALRVYALLEKLAAHCCHRIITVSEFHRRWGLELNIADASKIVAIPNGIHCERIEPLRDPQEVRREYAVRPKDVVILSTGRLAAGKGLEDLLDAAAKLRHRGSRRFHVWLAGDGPMRQSLVEMVQRLALKDIVRFVGFQREVGNLLAASDLVALPSLREGLSIALLEAMAAGKPVIATDIGSNVEVTRGGKAAKLVRPQDPNGLADAIEDLMQDSATAQRLAAEGRDVCLSNYLSSRMLEHYKDEYRKLLVTSAGEPRPVFETARGKRALDLAVAGAAAMVLAPLMIAIALAVRLTSKGPAWFRQVRLGRGGSPFTLYKFRTMTVNAPDLRNPDGSAYSAPNDPRVTPLGRFLRTSSLDELPQIFNVLRGEMSLVGPRPELPDQLRFYSGADKRRLLVRPGITGLAQLSGRNALSWGKRRQFDLEYVERQSFWLDVAILFKTLPYVLLRRGIYTDSQPEHSR